MSNSSFNQINYPNFDKFLIGYWHQMATDIYDNFDDAINDFKNTEGVSSFNLLVSEISAIDKLGKFPNSENLSFAYKDKFWSGYDRIVTEENVRTCNALQRQ